jgi:D-alanyl-D-alanine carboxypeptidase (penicillin-binding protein 5/6)
VSLAAALPFPVAASSYLIQVNDQTRWERAVDSRLAPASLTKLMMVLLLMENYQPEVVVTTSLAASHETGSRLGLHAGERMRVQDLLAASLLNSANDACHALADHTAGDQRRFVRRMNQRAQTWGLRDTHFSNACGHDDVRHYSSARDITTLAHRVMAYPVLLDLMARQTMDIRSADGLRGYALLNHNALIGRYEGAVGMKSGYTIKAGKCLVALARRDGVTVLLVMLHAENRWWDASDMLEYAYSQAAHD